MGYLTRNSLNCMVATKRRNKVETIKELRYWEDFWLNTFRGLRDGATESRWTPRADMLVFSHGAERLTERKRGKITYDHKIDTNISPENKEILLKQHIGKIENADVEEHRQDIPAEPHIWEALKRANNAAEVRRAFSRSKHWLIADKTETLYRLRDRRIVASETEGLEEFDGVEVLATCGTRFCHSVVSVLYDHADKFCTAKFDAQYPRGSTRRSDDRRIEYFARVLAGLSLRRPLRPSYADKILRNDYKSRQGVS